MIDLRPTYWLATVRRPFTPALTRLVARVLCILLLALVVNSSAVVIAQELVQSEAKLKSAFIFNFARFVEWPADAFSEPSSPLIVCIAGKDTLGQALDEVVRGKAANGRPVILRRFAAAQEMRPCHILFVSARSEGNLSQLLNIARGTSILTVGESEGFVKAGGIIRFVTVQDKLQFEISSASAGSSGLKISSRLMQLARKPRG